VRQRYLNPEVGAGIAMNLLGADTSHPTTDSLIDLSAKLLGASPAFFGRYFKGPHNPSPIQYQAAQENPILSARNIPLLCIARQTNRVGGSEKDGVADAVNNMSAITSAFGTNYLMGLGFDPLVFLDTEFGIGETTLSSDYYHGWAGALREQDPIAPGVRIHFTPAIYINRSDTKAWRALGTAMTKGAACHGAWVANYGKRTGAEGPPAWDLTEVTPKGIQKPPCPLLAWQYAGNYEDVLDFSILDETTGPTTLALLIPPPAPQNQIV
jgi:hypothetical protein